MNKLLLLPLILPFIMLFAFTADKSEEKINATLANPSINHPEELGQVNWIRNYDEAKKVAQQTSKPILILFQEVPGCGTCKRFGNDVLSHPLIVDAIEEAFVPLAIYNNHKGHDAEILKAFKEPAWNNPVVRFIDGNKKELSSRIGDYNALSLVNGMIDALNNVKQNTPAYLDLLQQDLTAQLTDTEKASFAMFCFWTGEAKLGNIDGVVSTEPGFMGGHEVVTVEYNPAILNFETLTKEAKNLSCASKVFVDNAQQKESAEKVLTANSIKKSSNFRADHEPKYYLSKSIYQHIPMLPVQASKVNALVGQGKDPSVLLSPRQLAMRDKLKAKNSGQTNYLSCVNFLSCWEKAVLETGL